LFPTAHAEAAVPLRTPRETIETGTFAGGANFDTALNAVKEVGVFYIFDMDGKKFRLIAAAHFYEQKLKLRYFSGARGAPKMGRDFAARHRTTCQALRRGYRRGSALSNHFGRAVHRSRSCVERC
jgi:mRNA-degrading endonuclease HigB of HigAB toxin-antitoxin module